MEDSSVIGFRRRPSWLLVVLALLAAQAWLTLRFFGAERDLGRLTGPEPVVSGKHPLHLYHGHLGARSLLERGTGSTYDPAFQAGYPKTPVFDEGCRPAELFLLPAGGAFSPAAYKIGLAVCCLLVPLAFVVAARGLGMAPPAACVCGALGLVVGWAEPARGMWAAGEVHTLLAGLAAVVHLTWLIRFARLPGLDSWGVLTASAAAGWYAHPTLWGVFLPLFAMYYLWIAWRQDLPWHVAWLGSAGLGFGVNVLWLGDWLRNWWLRSPGEGAGPAAPGISAAEAMLEYPLPAFCWVGGLVGLTALLFFRQRAAAALLGLAMAGTAALVGVDWAGVVPNPPRPEHWGALAGWCAVCPLGYLLARVCAWLAGPRPAGLLLVAAVTAGGLIGWDLPSVAGRTAPSLAIGLGAEAREAVDRIRLYTDDSGRILWEERAAEAEGWTSLLPVLSGRAYLGGLDPGGSLEHMFARLADGRLCGRAVADWTDPELDQFLRRYAVGWVVCRTDDSRDRFRRYPRAEIVAELSGGAGSLFELSPRPSYILRGQGEWVGADARRVALKDLVPSPEGDVVLSLHYHAGLRVAPAYVRLEPEIDPFDPIPLVRLRLPGPVPRLALTWGER
ncbi:MAG TPA: hypothetical protein VIL46_01650 [Gemmataceae bacterium]